MIIASYRSGSANYYRIGFPDGEIVELTDEPEIQGYSGIISPDGTDLLYTTGRYYAWRQPRDAGYTGRSRSMLVGQLGELSIRADNTALVAAMKRGNASYITVTHMDGTGGKETFKCPRMIIHPQFHPSDPELIEYAQDPAPCMWTIKLDGFGNTWLHRHDNDEFIVHETFLVGSGEDLIFIVWPYALKRMRLASREVSTIAEFNAWHIADNASGDAVLCDTVHPDLGLILGDVATGKRRTLCYPKNS